MKRVLLVLMCAAGLFLSVSCSKSQTGQADDELPSYETLTVGRDYTDLKATVRIISHKTDLAATVFPEYTRRFQELYPNITLRWETITNYAPDMTTRLSGRNWGDICMIPTYIPKTELSHYFYPFGNTEDIAETYNFTQNYAYDGKLYGIASMGAAQGVVYNKRVFAAAGIEELPKTPDEFLRALELIKLRTNAIPLYTNYAALWTMTAWDAYITGTATGDPDWANRMASEHDPFARRADMTGPYAVYYVLYEAVRRGLTEADPTTTDWEGSKGRMNRGEIGVMVLGSWAISQIQAAGPNAEDIGYMPFPISVNGKQYASISGDYNYGINRYSSHDNKLASLILVKWLVESSGFDVREGGISPLKADPLPETLSGFSAAELIEDNPPPLEQADLSVLVNNESELSLNADSSHVARIVEAAINGDESLDDIVADWNRRWNAAVDKYTAQGG